MVTPAKTSMTAAEFWAFIETTERRYELINGQIVEMAAPIPDQRVVGWTYILVSDLVSGGEVFIAPWRSISTSTTSRSRTRCGLAPDSQCRIGDKRLESPPDLIVEVFSPGARQHDKVTKFRLYEKCGVREYWLVDPAAQYIEVWRWADGRFVFQGACVPGETFNSPVLGISAY